jgi:hypothetical protein
MSCVTLWAKKKWCGNNVKLGADVLDSDMHAIDYQLEEEILETIVYMLFQKKIYCVCIYRYQVNNM